MSEAILEHINITVRDPLLTAELLVKLFDWHIRWQGEAINAGFSVHVGGADSYVALYSGGAEQGPTPGPDSHNSIGGLNHLGVVVDDLNNTEGRIKAAGFTTYSHGDYEPGRRFYFDDNEGLEIEVVSYTLTPH